MDNVVNLPKKKPYCILGCNCQEPDSLKVVVVAEILECDRARISGLTCQICGWKRFVESGIVSGEETIKS